MPYLPPVKSVKDFILWPFRFLFNLPMQEQALLGLILTLPLLAAIFYIPDRKPASVESVTADSGYLKTGILDNNLDSLRIRQGSKLLILARQGSFLWAETPDGKNRGFIKANTVFGNDNGKETTITELPERRKLSRYFISKRKFEDLMHQAGMSLDILENGYIHAEYIHTDGAITKAEFGFHIVDSLGRQYRPVISFNSQGRVKDYELVPWRKPKGFIRDLPIDLVSPLVSISEFQTFSPFDHGITNLIWTYLMGYLPLFIFMIILWTRYPLIWMPNPLANFIICILIFMGPVSWYMLLRLQGISWFPVLPVTLLMIFFGILFFWMFYSGLRCPRCKHLISHRYTGSVMGKVFTRVSINPVEEKRENVSHRAGSWKYGQYRHDRYGNVRKASVMTHYYTDTVWYGKYKTTSQVRRNTKHYVCPKCGHGKDKHYEEVLESNTERIGGFHKTESYTREEVNFH